MSNLNGLRERLRDHPEYIEIELMGKKRPFLLSMYGVEVARKRGYDLVPVILDVGTRIAKLFREDNEDIEIGSEEFTEKIKSLIRDEDARALSLIVWWGLVTFDTDLTLEEVQIMLTPGALLSLVPKVTERLNSFAEDRLEEESVEGDESDDPTEASLEPESNEPVSAQDTRPENTGD